MPDQNGAPFPGYGLIARKQTRVMLDVAAFARMRQVRDFIAEHHADPLRLDDIAAQAGYSPFHLHRLFVRAFDQTPGEFLTAVRLQSAQSMLRNPHVSVSEVCVEVGYSSLASFSTLFRSRYGCPPTEFRRVFASPDIWALKCMPSCYRTVLL